MATVQDLQKRIEELEQQLILARQQQCVREKIENMSSEVVDSNPYR